MSDLSALLDTVPERIRDAYEIARCEVAKFGYVHLELSDPSERVPGKDAFEQFAGELYQRLESVPHVMEIAPTKDELLRRIRAGEIGMGFAPYRKTAHLSDFLRLRVVLPERKKLELFGLFPGAWCPEEFTLWFDGALFLAHAPTADAPVSANLGQVAREFLARAMTGSPMWKRVEGIGPTPIHPTLYVCSVKRRAAVEAPAKLPLVAHTRSDLVLLAESENAMESVGSAVLIETSRVLRDFYMARVAAEALGDQVANVERLRGQLDKLLAEHFESASLSRLFGPTTARLRRALAALHSELHQVSARQFDVRRRQDELARALSESVLFKPISKYLVEHAKPDAPLEREPLLAAMNFAAEEAGNRSLVQATLFAALAGALLGGLLTAAGQAWLK